LPNSRPAPNTATEYPAARAGKTIYLKQIKRTTGLSENERLLRSFEFMETRMRHCGDRISEAVNRTADRFWNLLLR